MSIKITQEQINNTIISVLEMQLEVEKKDLQEEREEYAFRLDNHQGINGSLHFRLNACFRNIELIEASLKYFKESIDK